MPILKPVMPEDPFAPVAWDVSVSILALEKLANGEDIDSDERTSLGKVLEFLDSMSAACRLEPDELLSFERSMCHSSLLASLCASPAGGPSHGVDPLEQLEQASSDFGLILQRLGTNGRSPLDVGILRRAQEACLTLLENLNSVRPNPDQPPYLDF